MVLLSNGCVFPINRFSCSSAFLPVPVPVPAPLNKIQLASPSQLQQQQQQQQDHVPTIIPSTPSVSVSSSSSSFSRRQLIFSVSLFVAYINITNSRGRHASAAIPSTKLSEDFVAEDDEDEYLERYTDHNEGFTLLVPHSWVKVDKAGATALFEDPTFKGNNVGIVVYPVRISSLTDFGTPSDVASKIIQAEKKKESTKDVEVIRIDERREKSGQPVYEFEYRVDSTRDGLKRIFSAAFVASKKLFLLNILHSDSQDKPLDSQNKKILERVLRSFDVAS